MPWKMSEKLQLIAKLQRVHQDGQRLELQLRVRHPEQDADGVWQASQRLSTEIDGLIGRAMDDWRVLAKVAIKDLRSAEQGLKSAAEAIKKSIAVAKNCVKAVGF